MLRLIGEEKVRECLRIIVKARSVLAFAKSVGHSHRFERKSSIMSQFRVESQITKNLLYLRAADALIHNILTHYRIREEYGRQKTWVMALEMAKNSGVSPLLVHLEMLKERGLLGNLPRTYGLAVEDNQLFRVFRHLLANTQRNCVRLRFFAVFYV